MCVFAHTHLCALHSRANVCVLPQAKCCCLCVRQEGGREEGRKGGRGEVLSRTRTLWCFILHSFSGERGKKKVERGRIHLGLQIHSTWSLWRLQSRKMKISSVVFALLAQVLLRGEKRGFDLAEGERSATRNDCQGHGKTLLWRRVL